MLIFFDLILQNQTFQEITILTYHITICKNFIMFE